MLLSTLLLAIGALTVIAGPLAVPKGNHFSCRSTKHPNPVIALHGLFFNKDLDLNFLEAWLRQKGYCTFSLTYGLYPNIPLGGIKPINESAVEIADFIKEVLQKTGASKVDIVGHSEGALQGLYVPKFAGVAHLVDHVIAIAPPTQGSTLSGLLLLAKELGVLPAVNELLDTIGCQACNDVFAGSDLVKRLNDGPIVQPGNKVTVIASRFDYVVTPSASAFVHEDGVANIFVQDYCPLDLVGHGSLAIDSNMWNLVLNSLEDKIGRKFFCVIAPPVRRGEEMLYLEG